MRKTHKITASAKSLASLRHRSPRRRSYPPLSFSSGLLLPLPFAGVDLHSLSLLSLRRPQPPLWAPETPSPETSTNVGAIHLLTPASSFLSPSPCRRHRLRCSDPPSREYCCIPAYIQRDDKGFAHPERIQKLVKTIPSLYLFLSTPGRKNDTLKKFRLRRIQLNLKKMRKTTRPRRRRKLRP